MHAVPMYDHGIELDASKSSNLKQGCGFGMERFIRQTVALTRKTLLLMFRSTSATFAQIWIGVVFLVLLVIVGAAIKATAGSDTSFVDTPTSLDLISHTPMRNCTVGKNQPGCYAFAYGTTNGFGYYDEATIESIVDAMAVKLGLTASARNVPYGILKLDLNWTSTQVDSWILSNPNITKSIVLFENSHQWVADPMAPLRYVLQTNATKSCQALRIFRCDEPWLDTHIPIMTALHASFVSAFGGESNAAIKASFTNFPHPDGVSAFDSMGRFGSLFVYIALIFSMVITLTTMVREKQNHLVESMRQMGMLTSAYWVSWFLATTIINSMAVILMMIFGYILNFSLFVKTDGLLIITILWLSSQAFTSVAFFFSAFLQTESSARVLVVAVFVVTFIASPLLYQAYFLDPSQDFDTVRWVVSIIPFFSFFVLFERIVKNSTGSTTKGMRWDDRAVNLLPSSVTNSRETFWSLESNLQWLVASSILFYFLAWYFEQVLPNEYGRRKVPWFFFTPSYWGFSVPCLRKGGRVDGRVNNAKPVFDENTDIDVRVEADGVVNQQYEKRPAVVIRGMSKIFGKFKAVDNVFYSMAYGQLTALLGHNGSGKSTTFNMLTGLTEVTSGDAEVFGRSVRGDMSVLHANMGVCPQHDVLWDRLTAREHLELFSTIKGLDTAQISQEAMRRLEQVKLTYAADRESGKFSGGMRRRLSIAIALLGDPAIVFLDEPTTGMDTVTRAEVLDMISEAKQGRVMIMTSHAMEEVEMLADKVVVMSHGRIQAVGTNLRLKKRFGKGYAMTMFTEQSNVDKITKYILGNAPKGTTMDDARSDLSTGRTVLTARLPRQDDASIELIPFFKAFESNKSGLGISDFSLALSTMEEVFLNLSKSEEDREDAKMMKNPKWKRRFEEVANYRTNFKERKHVPFTAQVNALFWKSLTFQCKNFWSCCCSVSFPVIILVALFMLNFVLFVPLRIKAVCGEGVSKDTCARDGYDLDCVASLYQFRPLKEIEGVTLGKIDLFGNRGQPINPNCDSLLCYTNLEKVDSRNFPVSVATGSTEVPGYVNHVYPSAQVKTDLFNWYADSLFIFGDTECRDRYDNTFSLDSCKSLGALRGACEADVRKLQIARDYFDASANPLNAGIGSCTRTSGTLVPPTQVYLDRIAVIKNQRLLCEGSIRTNLTLPLLGQTALLSQLSAVTKNASGILSNLSFDRLVDPVWRQMNKDVYTVINTNALIVAVFGSNATFPFLRAAWYQQLGVPPTDFQFIPTLEQICAASVYNTLTSLNVSLFTGQLGLLFGSPAITNNFCLVSSNLDKLRLLSTENFNSNRVALDRNVYTSWFGFEYQTPFMRNYSSTPTFPIKQKFRARHFFSKFGALHVHALNSSTFRYSAYTNRTANSNQKQTNWKELVYLADNAFVQSAIARELAPRFKEMPAKFKCNRDLYLNGTVRELECDILPGFLQLSIVDFVAGALLPYLLFLYAFLIVNQLVYEKERGLKIIARINGGLGNSAYWLVTFVFYYAQYLVLVILIKIVGDLGGLRYTSLHDASVYWLFVLTWGFTLVALSFLLSIPFSTAEASTAGVFLFILVFILIGSQLINNLIADPFATEANYSPLMWMPPWVMIRISTWMAQAGAFGEKIRFADLRTYGDGAIATSIGILWVEFFACVVLVWYLDNVYVAGFGTAKPWNFFLSRKYWAGEDEGEAKKLREYELITEGDELKSINNPDVKAEYERVVNEASPNLVARIVRMRKEYDNGFVAVKSVSFGVDEKNCYGLIGHNGCGKSSLINMLAGMHECTSGTATIDGYSINTDMDIVQSRMGVCPQHDVVWGILSVRDHLLFYARLKGIPKFEISKAVDKALFDVNLKQFEHRRADKLSGGMRRRLSTAMALIGAPRIVYCDEPSTGLDPASKRALWKVIANAKGNKSIVLTTHSLEEAEVLCDRIVILALGEVVCIGTSAELKQRYGAGYSFFLQTDGRQPPKVVVDFAEKLFGTNSVKMLGKPLGGAYKFEVQRSAAVLSSIFLEMESPEVRTRLGLLDWSLTETTLEEVFLKLCEENKVQETMSKPFVGKPGFFAKMCGRKGDN